MKTIPALAILAALAAFIFFPLSFELSLSLLFATGFAAITFADYTRTRRPLMIPVGALVSPGKERFGLAA
jgi:hypothetical protein